MSWSDVVASPRRPKRCQYGVLTVRCNRLATTRRQRPSGRQTWDVCAEHAAFLDRLRAAMVEHRDLLNRLR